MGTLFVLQGTAVNALAIIAGAIIGILLPRIPEHYKTTVMQAIGLAVIVIGVDMALDTKNSIVVIMSAVIGGIIGEALRLEARLDQFGVTIERLFIRKNGKKSEGKIAKGFVFATLIYCVGSMAIVGALESGLLLKHDVLYTKAMLDGFSAIIFSSTMGIGVMISAAPVFLYEGIMALSANILADFLNEDVINEVRAVGGLLIIGIGLNLLEIKNIKVANLLPSIFVAAIVMAVLTKM
jgi:uncharacterized membrane protein YqgA involved in biofilm formation